MRKLSGSTRMNPIEVKKKIVHGNLKSLTRDRHKNLVIWWRELGGNLQKIKVVDRMKVVVEGMKGETDDLEMRLANH